MERIDPGTTALVLLDFQNDIADPNGKFAAMGIAAHLAHTRAIDHAAQALTAARAHGVPVIHIMVAWRPGHPELNGAVPFWANIIEGDALVEGTWGTQFLPALAPAADEVVIVKRGVSAFNGTELGRYLACKGIATLVLAGVATNWVVEGTTRDAADLGYTLVVLEDCCASFSAELHRFSMEHILSALATLRTAEAFTAAL